jgi:hypothetical protein
MSADIEQKRQWVIDLYPYSKTWAPRVKKMSDAQVLAIYFRNRNKPQEKKAS